MRSTKCVAGLLLATTVCIGLGLFARPVLSDQSPSERSSAAVAKVQQSTDDDERLEGWKAAREDAKQPIDPGNLEALERVINVEPEYEGDERHYYCLIFDDDQSQMMWMVFDESVLYVDCNFNGDLTDDGEAFPANEDNGTNLRTVEKFSFTTGAGQDVSLEFTFPGFLLPGSDPNEYPVRIQVTYRGATFSAWGDQTGEVANARTPAEAAILRVNGPLQMGFEVSSSSAVERTENGRFEVSAGVGTYGLGKGSFMHLKYWHDAMPEHLFPQAELEFPAEDKSKPNVVAKMKLSERC